jgi:very-short-patch-repair endonuclease
LKFRRQQIIDGFIADVYCHASALVVEVDGAAHVYQADSDCERAVIFAARVCW